MTHLLDKLNIRALSVKERIQLVDEIWGSIAEERGEFELTDAQRDEIDRRLESYRANTDMAIPGEVVKERVENDL